MIAEHKGYPNAVKHVERTPRRRRLKGARGRGTPDSEKLPVFGMIQPLIESTVALGSLIYTDEYSIYNRLTEWGYEHKSVNHSSGEYARDEDGFREVHVNTMEGFWSLLRSWIRPHRGISQEKSPHYFSFFEYVHNVRKRGEAVLNSLIQLLLS